MQNDTRATQHVTIDEAARLLELSRGVVEHRLASGELAGHKVGAQWLVCAPVGGACSTAEATEPRHSAVKADGEGLLESLVRYYNWGISPAALNQSLPNYHTTPAQQAHI